MVLVSSCGVFVKEGWVYTLPSVDGGFVTAWRLLAVYLSGLYSALFLERLLAFGYFLSYFFIGAALANRGAAYGTAGLFVR